MRGRRSSGGFWRWPGSGRAEGTGWAGTHLETEWVQNCREEAERLTTAGGGMGLLPGGSEHLSYLAELGCEVGGCGDGWGGGGICGVGTCTGEGDDIMVCCCTCGEERDGFPGEAGLIRLHLSKVVSCSLLRSIFIFMWSNYEHF